MAAVAALLLHSSPAAETRSAVRPSNEHNDMDSRTPKNAMCVEVIRSITNVHFRSSSRSLVDICRLFGAHFCADTESERFEHRQHAGSLCVRPLGDDHQECVVS